MAKESLFNVLGNKVDFNVISVLDLFAGTGNISFEFASRGAVSVTAVDLNSKCVNFINRMADRLNFLQLTGIRSDAINFLQNTTTHWDLVFADPPYNLENKNDIHRLIYNRKLLNPSGIFIIEHDKSDDFSALEGFVERRKYGKVNFSFFSSLD